MQRVILHCDADSFFASVESVGHPEYQNVPFAVCGDPEKRHGIVLAKNQLAKQCGIKTGQTLWQAKRLCPNLVWCLPHHDRYETVCGKLNQIYLSFTDRVEPYSIDESFLDVTASQRLFGDGMAIAQEIHRRVQAELGITVSIGVSFNRTFAKLGSDYQKPNGTTLISAENYRDILYPLPVERMLFVGAGAYRALSQLHIRTIGDLAHSSCSLLEAKLGKMGKQLHDFANARDLSPVSVYGAPRPVKSVGKGMTYEKDLTQIAEVEAALWYLCDHVAHRLRMIGRTANQISLAVKDPNLKVCRKQIQLDAPTSTAKMLWESALRLFFLLGGTQTAVRALTVTAGSLFEKEEEVSQVSFLCEKEEQRTQKFDAVEQAMDEIRLRYGWNAVDAAVGMQKQTQAEQEETNKEESP